MMTCDVALNGKRPSPGEHAPGKCIPKQQKKAIAIRRLRYLENYFASRTFGECEIPGNFHDGMRFLKKEDNRLESSALPIESETSVRRFPGRLHFFFSYNNLPSKNLRKILETEGELWRLLNIFTVKNACIVKKILV